MKLSLFGPVRAALLAFTVMACSSQAAAQDGLGTLLQQDLRLATVAERMLSANSALCRRHMPITGIVLHSRDQYPKDMESAAFTNGPVAVAAVVPGSPASAEVKPGDGLAAIGETRTSSMHPEAGSSSRDAAFETLADQNPESPVSLVIARGGQERAITLNATPGCRALVEILVDPALKGRSDGRIIQVTNALAEASTDDELAVVFAHELAHLVLEHRRRLSAAGVEKGFFGEFGRNQQLNRQVEVEADRMTAHLLANAGYDPRIAPAFWRSTLGRRTSGGLLHSRVYPSAESRAALIEREIADYLGNRAGPSYPGHLLTRRDIPFE